MENADEAAVKAAKDMIAKDSVFDLELHEWFRQPNCPYPEIGGYDEWLDRMLDRVAGDISEDKSAEMMFAALMVDTLGLPEAYEVAECAVESETQRAEAIESYAQGSRAVAEIWAMGRDRNELDDLAGRIRENMEGQGYRTVITYDDECDNEAVVTASMGLAAYLKRARG